MIQVYSEIGNLKKVMLHRPGNEIKQIHPFLLQEMLFEDTPYLKFAQQEHDEYAGILRSLGVEVIYLRALFQEAVTAPQHRSAFIKEFVEASGIPSDDLKEKVTEYYTQLSLEDFVEAVFCGIRRDNPFFAEGNSLATLTYPEDLFIVNPMPNCYFTRDNSINIADSVIISNMSKADRKREPLLLKYIHQFSSEFAEHPTENLYSFDLPYGIEGGDVLILSDKIVCIGCTERTAAGAIEYVAKQLFRKGYEEVYAFEFERGRNAMHLDGMLTMIDHDKFIYNSFLSGKVNVFRITPSAKGGIQTVFVSREWEKVLEQAMKTKVQLIPCGGGDLIQGMWEMWNLGSNVLTVRPGEVVGYNRDEITLDLLDQAGVKVHTFNGSELSRGRGGARCMSMPVYRER